MINKPPGIQGRFQWFQNKFQNAGILQISTFWHQNRIWGFNLHGKSVLVLQKGPKRPNLANLRRDSRASEKFQNSWNFQIPNAESGSAMNFEWKKHPILWFWSNMVELWAKTNIGRLKSAEIGRPSKFTKNFLIMKIWFLQFFSTRKPPFWAILCAYVVALLAFKIRKSWPLLFFH